jgi:hypothetical protein
MKKSKRTVPKRTAAAKRKPTTKRDNTRQRRSDTVEGEPGPGEQIPGTSYTRCDKKCAVSAKQGTDKRKVKCVPTPGNQKCAPNDADKPEKCHCRGFIKDGDNWKEPKKDDDGWYDNNSDNPVRCWCVRKT